LELAAWVDELAGAGRLDEPMTVGEGGSGGTGNGHGVAAEVGEILGPLADWVAHELDGTPELLPLVLTKGVSSGMLQCEANALDDSGADRETWALQRGNLLDVLVAIAASQRLDTLLPIAPSIANRPSDSDPSARGDTDGGVDHQRLRDGLTGALRALDKGRLGDVVEALDDARMDEVWELAQSARGVKVDPSWSPRTEVAHRLTIGSAVDSAVELRGRMDLVIGGPGTGLRGVCVEVKSGSPHQTHRSELNFYSLLWTLRTGSEPAGLALWYPGSGISEVPVHGTAIAGAKQAARAIERLAQIRLGEEPGRKAGPQCRWCGLLTGCDLGNAYLDGREDQSGLLGHLEAGELQDGEYG
jgi:hypothetical protein